MAILTFSSQPDLGLMNSVCVTANAEQDEILRTIIKILDAHSKTMPIIRQSITNEVGSTQNPATLFRGNSTATKLMSAYTKMTGIYTFFLQCLNGVLILLGRNYLVSVIKPLVDEVTQNVVSCEVDSSKIPSGEDIEQNMRNLLGLCQKFLDGMMSSVDSCPYAFRVRLYPFLC